jgi:putative polyketide hydroxylase
MSTTSAPERVPVLIVGGGIVGLSAALFLQQHGVHALVVERHRGTSIHPRARGINGRTAELYRELGILEEIRAAGAALGPAVGFLRGATLAAAIEKVPRRDAPSPGLFGPPGALDFLSPTAGCRCTQDLLEPILLATARARGGDLRFGTELTAFEDDGEGVTATLVERDGGATRTVRADWVIAADGANTRIRGRLGIGVRGRGAMGHVLNVLCRVDLAELVRNREFSICRIDRPALQALLLSINNSDVWTFHIAYDAARTSPADYPPERCAALLREALGLGDVAVEIRGILPWEPSVRVAERLRQGRVFLAGDAAHQMAPWGGQGANTGIADVHNLAWKLAHVLDGRAGAGLLDSYDVERQPVGERAAEESAQLGDEHGLLGAMQGMPFGPDKLLWVLGYDHAYRSAAIVADGDPSSSPVVLDGRPGTRVPHAWITRDGARLSTLDLVARDFVLLTAGDAWTTAAAAANVALHRVDSVAGPLGLGDGGALLVRPDGFVAWRARTPAADALRDVIRRLRFRD